MVGTAARGGIRTVIEALQAGRLSASWDFNRVVSHDDVSLVGRLWLAASAMVRLFVGCASGRVSILHLHAAMRGSFWRKAVMLQIGRLWGVPGILHLHGSEMELFYDSSGPYGKRLIKRTLESAFTVVVLSNSWRTFVRSITERCALEVIPNFVPVPVEAQCRPRAADEPLSVLFLGYVGDRKGVFDLIKAVALLPGTEQRQVRLVIGGNGELDRLRAVIHSAEIASEVQVLGWTDPTQKRTLLETCHVLALPSYNEGLPMALLEAMGSGLPVLTSPVGGIPELVRNGENGLLCQPGDTHAIARSISFLLTDDEARLTMGRNARQMVVEFYSEDSGVQRWDALYRNARARRPGSHE